VHCHEHRREWYLKSRDMTWSSPFIQSVPFNRRRSTPSPLDRCRPLLLTCFYTYATRRNLSRFHHIIYEPFHESREKSFRFHPHKIVLAKYISNRIAVPPIFSAFIQWTLSNAPTSSIKVCLLLILINCGCNHLSTLIMVIPSITTSIYWAIFCVKNPAE